PHLVVASRTEPAARRPVDGSHPVRDKLLARARSALGANDREGGAAPPPPAAAAASAPAAADDEWDLPEPSATPRPGEPGYDPAPELADDLDLIGAPQRPRPERTPHAAPALPPSTALLIGTVAGLAALALGFAALIRFDPQEPLRLPAHRAAPASRDMPEGEAPSGAEGESGSEAAPGPDTAPAPPVSGSVQRPPRVRVAGPWRIPETVDPGSKRLQGNVGERSFLGATGAAGMDFKEAFRVVTAFGGVKDLDRCRPKDTFTAVVDATTGRVSAFEYTVSSEEVYQAREGSDGRLSARRLDLDVKRHRVQGVVVVNGSFEESARRAGFEAGLGDVVNKALAGYFSTTEFRPGDVLAIVAQEVSVLGEFKRYAGVEALEYRPVSGAEPLRIYYHESERSRGYVDSKGRVFGKSRWTRPVPGAGVTSRFNPRRMHPILKRIKPHNGTDFGAPIGTPVLAAASGRVSFVGRAGPNGNMVTISHGAGFQTGYSHLSRFAKGLRVGSSVDQRQLIGYVGSTGRSTGPHLHFSAKRNGRFIDPESLSLDGTARIVDQRLPRDLRRRYDHMLDSLQRPGAPAAVAVTPAQPGRGAARTPYEVELAAARGESAASAEGARAPVLDPPMSPPASISLEPAPATVLPLPPEHALPGSDDPAGDDANEVPGSENPAEDDPGD
ncbi:MAG TPA: peptidoglycan DD-metalloendopeptidase family protein, partial [Polyangiaceae bacterium]|nr:peptidoglycan DD-metalloendopeptidase family protein [Polyangiaceae bacterium]